MNIRMDNIIHALGGTGPLVYLESQLKDHSSSRRSLLAALPESTIRAYGDKIIVEDGDEQQTYRGNPWDALSAYQQESRDWIFGYLGYDLKNHTEELHSSNPDQIKAPDMFFMKPGLILERKVESGDIRIVKGDLPAQVSLDFNVERKIDFDRLHSNVEKTEYLRMIEEAQHRIREGEFYEINLSHQLSMDIAGDPLVLYSCMKEAGPVPFGAYIELDDITVSCLSPERFMAKEGSKVFSQPIKGTIGRGESPAQDEKMKRQLLQSAKDRSENLMIVDLVRNDLNRVAKTGSVSVPRLFEIQTFETVHQMVSTIQAEVEEYEPVEIIKTCFPMGSMTGAPKISAMKSIEELERYKRGIYSGAIGYFTPENNFDFNVVIRSAIIKKDTLYYAVGGAITSDSDPEKEWEETMVKSRALTAIMRDRVT